MRCMVAVHSGGGNTQVNLVKQDLFCLENGTLVFLSGTHIFLFFSSSCKRDASGSNLASSWIKTAACTA